MALLLRRAMLDALPSIITAASKPMEQIGKISILDSRGLHGNPGAPETAEQSGNLADVAVAAAMKYKGRWPSYS